mmetsp:Transcript_116278/g.333923  ORF Transcript_116278/g.333923 Transcript_116278/m.333923 type:complete len:294 (-) Transcript_116278:159-1040(-)
MLAKTSKPASPRSRRQALVKPYLSFIARSSWLPRTSQTLSGINTFIANKTPMSSNWCRPRSTKSPLNTKSVSPPGSGAPKAWKSSSKSRSCPCVSPKIRHGADAFTTIGCEATSLRAPAARSVKVLMGSDPNKRCNAPPSCHILCSMSLRSLPSSCINARALSNTAPAVACKACCILCIMMLERRRACMVLTIVPADCVVSMCICFVCRYMPTRTPQAEMTSPETVSTLENILLRRRRARTERPKEVSPVLASGPPCGAMARTTNLRSFADCPPFRFLMAFLWWTQLMLIFFV